MSPVGGEDDLWEARVVLGRKDPMTMVGFQWTGEEPDGLNNIEMALALGAVWEGDELVTNNQTEFTHNFSRLRDGWMEDSD
jgi:hypothetical protein